MRSRYTTQDSLNSRHWQRPTAEKPLPRHPVRYDRPAPTYQEINPQIPSELTDRSPKSLKLSETELVQFSLVCIERLTCTPDDDPAHDQPVEQTIAEIVQRKLPGFTALKAELESAERMQPIPRMRTESDQAFILQLRAHLVECENAIAENLQRTGETIGLPHQLLTKLVNLTKTILSRMSV